jgi:hypothetical protein
LTFKTYFNYVFQIRWLRAEQKLIDLDLELKKSVHFQTPNMELCLKRLKELQTLSVAAFMLKKQPAIVQTVKMLQKYCGPSTPSQDQKVTPNKMLNRRLALLKCKT